MLGAIEGPPQKKFRRSRNTRRFRASVESGQARARTADTGLFRAVLYQLSYLTEPPKVIRVVNGKGDSLLAKQIKSILDDHSFPGSRILGYPQIKRQSVRWLLWSLRFGWIGLFVFFLQSSV